MDFNSIPRTSIGEGQGLREQEHPGPVDTKPMARFPSGTKIQPLSLLEGRKSHDKTKTVRGNVARLPRLPLGVMPPTATPSKPPPIQYDSPWETYKPIQVLNRGGMVTSACLYSDPAKLVTIKKLSSGCTKELAVRHHENLLAVLELYKFDDALFVVTDYTTAPLRQLLSSAGELQEACVSSVFNGMQHLAKSGLAHQQLDSSRILLMPETALAPTKSSLVKIAHFDECQITKCAPARRLGIIAFEMMERSNHAEDKEELILSNPRQWSPEASDFLSVTSWATLKDIANVRQACLVESRTALIDLIAQVYT